MTTINDECYLFTEFLEDTKDKVKAPFSTAKWLKIIDTDSLNMLQGYIDNFTGPSKDVNDEAVDMLCLIKNLAQLENRKAKIPENDEELAIIANAFLDMIVFESLRRKGLVSIEGEGLISKKFSTTFDLTSNVKKICKKKIDRKQKT